MSPSRPSSPGSERRRSRRDTSARFVGSIGTWTRRPSAAIITATVRRSPRSNQPNWASTQRLSAGIPAEFGKSSRDRPPVNRPPWSRGRPPIVQVALTHRRHPMAALWRRLYRPYRLFRARRRLNGCHDLRTRRRLISGPRSVSQPQVESWRTTGPYGLPTHWSIGMSDTRRWSRRDSQVIR